MNIRFCIAGAVLLTAMAATTASAPWEASGIPYTESGCRIATR